MHIRRFYVTWRKICNISLAFYQQLAMLLCLNAHLLIDACTFKFTGNKHSFRVWASVPISLRPNRMSSLAMEFQHIWLYCYSNFPLSNFSNKFFNVNIWEHSKCWNFGACNVKRKGILSLDYVHFYAYICVRK